MNFEYNLIDEGKVAVGLKLSQISMYNFRLAGRKTTHDFLSLYSPIEQDPRPMQGKSPNMQEFFFSDGEVFSVHSEA